ncbi:MEDS domain-containing protein [Halopenitus salinus]|uniref:MEDS domain-containing protein n=1 Tax=Halopenitus salinus TaxID=1198295 RepID=A0ABD5UUJ1_9EURY
MSKPEVGSGSDDVAVDALRYETLRTSLEREDVGRHLALFYDAPAEQRRAAAAFVETALRRGDRCLYLADTNDVPAVERLLETAGIGVDRHLEDGTLEIHHASEVYLEDGFDPNRMADLLADLSEESVDDEYAGLAVAGENSWSFGVDAEFDEILEFEVAFDDRCPDRPVTAMCQYDMNRFDDRSIAKALWTHEHVIYRDTVCENPFYVPPSTYSPATKAHDGVRLQLEQTRELARVRNQLSEREQRLAVVDRTLRHNIRNELNVILGHLELLQTDLDPGSEALESIEICLEYAERVVDLSEKARYIQETLSEDTVHATELVSAVEDAMADVRELHPDARIELEGDGPIRVLAHVNLDAALAETITNAVTHQDHDPPAVSIRIDETGSNSGTVSVANPGDPIPEDDRKALLGGQETPLEHGGGIGLWLVKWVVEASNGTISFPENADERSEIRLSLPLIDR